MTRVTTPADRRYVGGEGQHNPGAVLDEQAVVEGRRRVRAGETIVEVAADLGVATNTLAQAVRGRSWRHLNEVEPPARGPVRPRHDRDPADREALRYFAFTMHRAGAATRDVARNLGVNENTVAAWLSGRR